MWWLLTLDKHLTIWLTLDTWKGSAGTQHLTAQMIAGPPSWQESLICLKSKSPVSPSNGREYTGKPCLCAGLSITLLGPGHSPTLRTYRLKAPSICQCLFIPSKSFQEMTILGSVFLSCDLKCSYQPPLQVSLYFGGKVKANICRSTLLRDFLSLQLTWHSGF